MARPTQDPLGVMTADGRVCIEPETHCGLPIIIDVNLEDLRRNVYQNLVSALN